MVAQLKTEFNIMKNSNDETFNATIGNTVLAEVLNSQKLYFVEARKLGNREAHTYPLGIFTDLEEAINVAEFETTERGGVYNAVVIEMLLNYDYSDDSGCFEIYESDIPYHYRKQLSRFPNVVVQKELPVFGKIRERKV